MKVFFDSNIHISEVIVGGAATLAFRASARGRWKLLTTDYVMDEVEGVLVRKFGFGARRAAARVNAIREVCEVIAASQERHKVSADPDDTPVLCAALGGGADYLVTRDDHLLRLGQVESLRIVTLTAYLDLLRSHGHVPARRP